MRVLAFEGGAWRQSGDLRPEDARDLAWGPTHVWIRLEGLQQSKLDALGAVFDLHPLAIEDVRNHRQRPKEHQRQAPQRHLLQPPLRLLSNHQCQRNSAALSIVSFANHGTHFTRRRP